MEDFHLLTLQTSEPLWQVNLGIGDHLQHQPHPNQDHPEQQDLDIGDVPDPGDQSELDDDDRGPPGDFQEEEDDWSPVLPRRDGIHKFL